MRTSVTKARRRWSAAMVGIAAISSLALVLGLAPLASAQGDSAWPQYHGDSENSRQGAVSVPDDPGLNWHVDLEDEGYSVDRPYFGFVGLLQPVLGPDDTVITRAEGADPDDADETVPYLLGIDGETGDLAWEQPVPGLRARCGQALDEQDRVWASVDDPDDGYRLAAFDAISGEPIDDADIGPEDAEVERCRRSTLHLGGDPEHLAVFDSDAFGVFDVSGDAPSRAWGIDADEDDAPFDELVRWRVTGGDSARLAVFTDDTIIVPTRSGEDEDQVAELIEFDLDDGSVVGRVDIEILPDDGGDANPADIQAMHFAVSGSTLVVGTQDRGGAASVSEGSVAAYDLDGGLDGDPLWLEETHERGEPTGLVLRDGEAVVEHDSGDLYAYDPASGDSERIAEDARAGRNFASDATGGLVTQVAGDDLELGTRAVAAYDAANQPQWAFDEDGLEAEAGIADDDRSVELDEALIGPIDSEGRIILSEDESSGLASIDASGGLDVLDLPDVDEDRVAGADRIGTAIELAQSFDSADTVVIARADDYADALAGAPLASSLEAPVLLTSSDALDSEVAAEITRLGADEAVLLGGDTALSEQVETALSGLGVATERVAGANRFATAAAIADELPDPDRAFIARGVGETPDTGWEDAVAISALAAYEENPIVLSTTESLPEESSDALDALPLDGPEDVVLVGGTAVLSNDVVQDVATAFDLGPDDVATQPDRWAGVDRFDTSSIVATASLDAGMDPSTTWLATGRDFPDALAAAPVVGATAPEIADDGGVLLLIDGLDFDDSGEAVGWLERFSDDIDRVRAVGGDQVITDQALDAARDTADAQ